MAIITNIKKSNKYPTTSQVTYCEAEYNDYTYNGETFVRIQTFGSSSRQEVGKPSQVIHLNRDTAQQLIEYLKQSFKL